MNEEKRILRPTKKKEEDHFSLIDVIETTDKRRDGSFLLDCRNQGERRRRRPSFPRSPTLWSRTHQRKHDLPLPSLVTLMNKYSRSNTTKGEEADRSPQSTGLRRRTGNEKTTLLPQTAPLSGAADAAGVEERKGSATSAFGITAPW